MQRGGTATANRKTLVSTNIPMTWYVSFEVPKGSRKRSARRHPRLTATFPTELDAQKFARRKFEEGYNVTAGTIVPFTPRRAIAPTLIHLWLAEMPEQSLVETASSDDAEG